MRESRRQLLVLIEEKPRFVRDLVKSTGMRMGAIWEALRQLKELGVVESVPAPGFKTCRGGNHPHVYGIAGTDLSGYV